MLEQDEVFEPTAGATRDAIDSTPVDRIVYLLERLVESANGYPGIQDSLQAISTTPASFTNRMRVMDIVISCDNAGTIILNVGTTKYTFTSIASITQTFPFPIVIENGIDVFLSGTGTGRMWLVYVTE